MNQELATNNGAEIIERVVIAGDLSKLSAVDRVAYYRATCDSLGLNSLTKPFEYIELSGKLTLYATRTATDQLREMKRISLRPVRKELNTELNIYVVEVEATTPDGRTDFATGVVSIAKEDGTWESSQSGKRFFKGNGQWKQFRGDDLANAIMKAETKAKRRATLSVCGLGWMDETEVETVATAQRVHVDTSTGEIVSPPARPPTNGTKPGAVEKAPLPPITDQERAQTAALDHGQFSGIVSEQKAWYTAGGEARLMFRCGTDLVIVAGALAEKWNTLEDGDEVVVGGHWKQHAQKGAYLAPTHIELITEDVAPPAEEIAEAIPA